MVNSWQLDVHPPQTWYPLVNVYITNLKDPPFCSWVNPLFLWPFSIANCKRLPEGIYSEPPTYLEMPAMTFLRNAAVYVLAYDGIFLPYSNFPDPQWQWPDEWFWNVMNFGYNIYIYIHMDIYIHIWIMTRYYFGEPWPQSKCPAGTVRGLGDVRIQLGRQGQSEDPRKLMKAVGRCSSCSNVSSCCCHHYGKICDIYIYIHIYMYIYTHIYIYTSSTYTHIYIYIYTYAHLLSSNPRSFFWRIAEG